MRKYLFAAAIFATTLSTPALADEGGEARIEARSGIVWGGGFDDYIGGVAAGYDFDLGDTVFLGPEISYDTDFEGFELVNVGGRVGFKAGERARIYAAAAYNIGDGLSEFNVGAGAQLDLTDRVYGKVEYRRNINTSFDANVATVSVGIKF